MTLHIPVRGQISLHRDEEAWQRWGEEWHSVWLILTNRSNWQYLHWSYNYCFIIVVVLLFCFFNFLIDTSNGDNLYNLLKVSCSVHDRVGFRMLFHLCLFADEAGVEMWCGCVCWLRGWGLNKSCCSFPETDQFVKHSCFSFGHMIHTCLYAPLRFCLWCNPFYLQVLYTDCEGVGILQTN